MAGLVNHKEIKLAALRSSPRLGMPQEWYGPDGLIDTNKRGLILSDIHAAHNAYIGTLRNEKRYVPKFLNQEAVNGLLGVEGFLMPKKKASYNTPADSKYTGVLQFGSAAFGHHAETIAARLNVMMEQPGMKNTSLGQMIARGEVKFPFDKANVWNVHLHPIAQFVGTAIHTADKHAGIDKLVDNEKISGNEARGLFVVAHNIPELSKLMIKHLGLNGDVPMKSAELDRYKPLMATNPALYQDVQSLRGILDKVSEYAATKADGIKKIMGGDNRITHAPMMPGKSPDNRQQLTELIKKLLQEQADKATTVKSDREKLNDMIKAITEERPAPAVPQEPQLISQRPTLPKAQAKTTPKLPEAQPPKIAAVQVVQPKAVAVQVTPPKVAAVQTPSASPIQPAKKVHNDAYRNDAYRPGSIAARQPNAQRMQAEAQKVDAEERAIAERGKTRQPPAAARGRPITTHSITKV